MTTIYIIGPHQVTTQQSIGLSTERYSNADYWKVRLYCSDVFSPEIQAYLVPNNTITIAMTNSGNNTIVFTGTLSQWSASVNYSYVDIVNATCVSSDTNMGSLDHGSLLGLSDDDHPAYPALVGRLGGQALIGGTGAGDNLTLASTSNGTKGNIISDDSLEVIGNIHSTGSIQADHGIVGVVALTQPDVLVIPADCVYTMNILSNQTIDFTAGLQIDGTLIITTI